MSTMSSGYKAVVKEIDSYLKNEELVVNTDQDRLSHLWALFLQTSTNLKSALENIDVVRSQFTSETKDLEGYVEHITKLSYEREARASECEAENEDLKEQIRNLRLQLASFDNSETRDMLLQAGLGDIVRHSSSRQIAYLLVERASFMDTIEELQNKTTVDERLNTILRLPLGGNMSDDVGETSWTKLKDLLEKVDDLESNNEHLMQRLKDLSPEEYQQLVVSQAQGAAAASSANSTPSRPKMSDFVPKKPFVPPKDLQEAISRLEAAEEKEAEAEFLRSVLNEKMMEHTLNDEESIVSMLGSPRGGFRTLERSSSVIQNSLSVAKSHIKQLVDPSGNISARSQGEVANKLEQEFERLKVELEKLMEKSRVQYRKYADHKLTVKNRMHNLKENFRQERLKLTEEIEQLQNDLGLVKVTLQKEIEYKDNMEKSHHTLLMEQQDLQIKLSEQEDLVQAKCRELAKLKIEVECLEDENGQLVQRLDNGSKQKTVFRIITP